MRITVHGFEGPRSPIAHLDTVLNKPIESPASPPYETTSLPPVVCAVVSVSLAFNKTTKRANAKKRAKKSTHYSACGLRPRGLASQ